MPEAARARRRAAFAAVLIAVALVHGWGAGRLLVVLGGDPPPERWKVEFVAELKPAMPAAFRVESRQPPAAVAAQAAEPSASAASAAQAASAAVNPDSRPAPNSMARTESQSDQRVGGGLEAALAADDDRGIGPPASGPGLDSPPVPRSQAASQDARRPDSSLRPGQASASGSGGGSTGESASGSIADRSGSDPLDAAGAGPGAAASQPVTAFEWPRSTRLDYVLSGWYRGEVHGNASVEWLLRGELYQVHLDSRIGPLMSRSLSSFGRIGARGLRPIRFDGEQSVLMQDTRRWRMLFGPRRLTLVDGREAPAPEGVQDEASQFVQITWLLSTRPDLRRPGSRIVIPLLLSRGSDDWTYELRDAPELDLGVLGRQRCLHFTAGRAHPSAWDAIPEIWFAPELQFLPVKIVIRQGSSTWFDLSLAGPPRQAER